MCLRVGRDVWCWTPREAVLDLAVKELDAEQREQYAKNHATMLREADWEKYKHIVDAFRDFTFGDFSPLGGVADPNEPPGKYDGVKWDDVSKTPNKYRIDRGLYGGPGAHGSVNPHMSAPGLSQSHPDLVGGETGNDHMLSTLDGHETLEGMSGSVATGVSAQTRATLASRKSSKQSIASPQNTGGAQQLSVVHEGLEDSPTKSVASKAPTTHASGMLTRKKSEAVVVASSVLSSPSQLEAVMAPGATQSKSTKRESKLEGLEEANNSDSKVEGKPPSKSGFGSKAQEMLDSGAAIIGFGAEDLVTLGLHVRRLLTVLYCTCFVGSSARVCVCDVPLRWTSFQSFARRTQASWTR